MSEGARREEKGLHVHDYGDCVSSSSVFRCRGEGLLHMLKPRLSMYMMKKRLSKHMMKPPSIQEKFLVSIALSCGIFSITGT